MPNAFPADFAELEPFADWALPTERERYAKRIASTMDELQAFYDAAFPRLEDATKYLEQFALDALPDDATAPAPAVLRARHRLVPGRGLASAARARQRCVELRRHPRTRGLTARAGAGRGRYDA